MNTILTDDEIHKWWASENGMEDADMAMLNDFREVTRKVETAVLAKLREQEPVAWQRRMRPTWGNGDAMWCPWEDCTEGQFKDCQRVPNLHDWEYQSRALYAAPLPAVVQVPQGWKLVPVEPTERMLAEVAVARRQWTNDKEHEAKVTYHIMLNASPEAPAPAAVQVPPGYKLVPVRLLEMASASIGSFVSDHGWSQEDVDTMDSIDAMLAAATEAPAQGDPLEKLTRLQEELGLYNDKPAQADMGNPISVPAPWREAVKVAREALQCNLAYGLQSCDDWVRDKAEAALAQLDALEGGE